ncbi:MAG: VWA domain-containing protein [Acidobacteria bacterium]|nr:VWA domain-containing protein [Acidobacteriota bacterium]
MLLRKQIILTFIAAAFFAASFVGFSSVEAQQQNAKSPAATPTPTPTPAVIEDDEVIKVDTEVVNVLFTAQDRNRRLITNLAQRDIRILENDKPQEITAFAKQVDLPLSLAILIDTSISQERTLPAEKSAAISFLESVVRPTKDEVAVISFTGESTLEQGMTNNMQRLRRAIDRVQFVPPSGYIGGGVITGTPPASSDNQMTAGSTAIWDSIWITSDEILGPAPEKTRRAIILLSDGVNTSGRKKLDDAIQAALKAEAIIYAVGVGDDFYGGVDRGSMSKIAERTGGRAFFPRDERELREAFKQIEDEMRSQYLIAYEPSNQTLDGSYRKIEIQLANQQLQKDKVKVTHRQGYFAKSPQKK